VAHACNPSYSEGRGQEDHGLKPAGANSSRDPILKKHITAGGVAQGVGLAFKPSKKFFLSHPFPYILQIFFVFGNTGV
jgi:hypothetical protein